MIDAFDYKEPSCPLCGGEDFYYPDREKPLDTIPIRSVIDKLNGVFAKNDLEQAEKILEYWLGEAKVLRDKRGELEIRSEQMGLFRKTNNRDKGLESVEEGIRLVRLLRLDDTVSGATVLLNAATTYKAFGFAEKGIPLYEEAEKTYNGRLEKNDSLFAGLYNNMALALSDVGKTAEAEDAYKKAISILSLHQNRENDIAVSYLNLAHLFDENNRQEEAYVMVEKAIEYLNTPTLPHDGYHAFVLSKCIPSLDYFGYFFAKTNFEKRMNTIYERT